MDIICNTDASIVCVELGNPKIYYRGYIAVKDKYDIDGEEEEISMLQEDLLKLTQGEMYVVPKGVEHKPCAKNECKILVVEPRGVINTGDARDKLTITEDVWV